MVFLRKGYLPSTTSKKLGLVFIIKYLINKSKVSSAPVVVPNVALTIGFLILAASKNPCLPRR